MTARHFITHTRPATPTSPIVDVEEATGASLSKDTARSSLAVTAGFSGGGGAVDVLALGSGSAVEEEEGNGGGGVL